MKKPQSPDTLTVIHVVPTPFFADRGCHMRVRGLILSLQKLGVRNLLCTYHHGREVEGIEAIRIPTIPGYTKLEAGPSGYKYIADMLLLFKVCQIIWREQPDIIHGHLHEGTLIGWMARWLFFWRHISLVFDVQGSLVGELEAHGFFEKLRFLRPCFEGVEWLITRMPTHFFCSSKRSLNILRDNFSVADEKLSLVSDGTDTVKAPAHNMEILRQKLQLPADRPVVIYTGALLEAKGLNDLCQLIQAAARSQIHCYFLIVGYPTESLETFLSDGNLQDWCTVTGRVPYEELSYYLSVAQLAIEPKGADSGEASGKLLNYMAAGLPVVCYDTPNNRDMLAEGGFFADRANGVDALVTTLKQALSDPEDAQRKGRIGTARIEQLFSWDSAATKVYNIYKQIKQIKKS